MIIIFQCYGGTHTSVAAASIYIGLLNRHRPPRTAELMALPYFDRLGGIDMGALHFIGTDERGNLVFALGSGNWGAEIRELAKMFLERICAPGQPVAVIDCVTQIAPLTRLGGFISRRLGLTCFGRPLVCFGIRRSFHCLLKRVEAFEKRPQEFVLHPRSH